MADEETITSEDEAAFDAGLDNALGATPPLSESDLGGKKAETPVVIAPTPTPQEQPPVAKTGLELTEGLDIPGAKKPEPKKEEPKKADVPVAPTQAEIDAAAKKAKDLESIDLDKVTPPDDISPKNAVNFGKLRETAKHYQAKATDLATQLTESQRLLEEAKKTTGQLPEDIKKELDDHRHFRKIFDAENSAEFKKEFDEKLGKLDTDTIAYLKKHGLSDDLAKDMLAAGLGKIGGDWWETHILSKLPAVQRRRVEDFLSEREKTEDSRSAAIEKFASDKDAYVKEQDSRKGDDFNNYRKTLDDHIMAVTKGIAWAQPRVAAADATPEQKAEIEAHNKELDVIKSRLEDALFPPSPQAHAEVAIAAVASTKLAEQTVLLANRLKEANDREAALKQELELIKSKGKIPGGGTKKKETTDDTPATGLSDEEAIEKGLEAAESGLK